MRDCVEDESLRLVHELCRLRERFDNLVYGCESLGGPSLINYAKEANDCLRGCIDALQRLFCES